jgi:hypothetical protein
MTPMRERAAVGTRWLRKRDKTVWLLRQSHRADRVAELVAEQPTIAGPNVVVRRAFVSFTDLRTKFEEVEA